MRPQAMVVISAIRCAAVPTPTVQVPTEPVVEEPVALPIVDTPLPFGDDRKALTLAYLRAHVDPAADGIDILPRVVVLHWTGGSYESAIATFSPATLEGSRPELASAGDLNVSAHFLVDRDGTIHRLMPETWMARHCIGLNWTAIGVENVGGPDAPLTEAQEKADADLVRYLAGQYPIERLIGHYEYQTLEGSPLFRELDAGYRTQKDDPGPEFMAHVRASLADLHLGGTGP